MSKGSAKRLSDPNFETHVQTQNSSKFPGHNNNNYHNDVLTTPTTTSEGPTSSAPSPYLSAYVTKTASEYYDFQVNLTSLTPDINGFEFQNRLLGWSQESESMIIFEPSSGNFSTFHLPINASFCEKCEILSYSEDVSVIQPDDVIFCCWNCQGGRSHKCSVKGHLLEILNHPVEKRISRDRTSLYLSTVTDPCTLQTIMVNGTTGFTKIGKSMICPNSTYGIQHMITTSRGFDTDYPYILESVINDKGDFILYDKNQNPMDTVFYSLNTTNTTTFTISTRFDYSDQYIALIFPTRIYVILQNVDSNCVTILHNGYVDYKYDGEFGGGGWVGNRLMIWFRERAGANISTFDFQFPYDFACSKQNDDNFSMQV